MREAAPTKSEALALADEGRLLREGYRFLDEKRMLLAGEILRQLADYERLSSELESARAAALDAFELAVERHGLDELQARRVDGPPLPPPVIAATSFLGVPMRRLKAAEADRQPAGRTVAGDLSAEVRAVQAAFARLALLGSAAGAVAGNLLRLARAYRRTERRAKALENVLLPELDALLKRVTEQLDSLDQEEAVRVRSLAKTAR